MAFGGPHCHIFHGRTDVVGEKAELPEVLKVGISQGDRTGRFFGDWTEKVSSWDQRLPPVVERISMTLARIENQMFYIPLFLQVLGTTMMYDFLVFERKDHFHSVEFRGFPAEA